MYLGEIVRRVLLRLAVQTALFGDNVPPQLEIPFVLRYGFCGPLHEDNIHCSLEHRFNSVSLLSYDGPYRAIFLCVTKAEPWCRANIAPLT